MKMLAGTAEDGSPDPGKTIPITPPAIEKRRSRVVCKPATNETNPTGLTGMTTGSTTHDAQLHLAFLFKVENTTCLMVQHGAWSDYCRNRKPASGKRRCGTVS